MSLSEFVLQQMKERQLSYPKDKDVIRELHDQYVIDQRNSEERESFDVQKWPCWNWRSGCLGHLKFVRFQRLSHGYGGSVEVKILQCDCCNEISSW